MIIIFFVTGVDTDIMHYGRKQAASIALEELTGVNYPKEYLAFGASCMKYKDLVEIGYKPVMSQQVSS